MDPAIPHETPPTGAAIESLLDGAGIGYAQISADGRMLAANDTLHRMLGRHRPSLRDCQVGVLGSCEDGEPLQQRFEAYRNGRSDLSRTPIRLASSGSGPRLATVTIQSVPASGGFPDGHTLLVLDATATKPVAAEAMQVEMVMRDHAALVTREASYFAHQVFHDPLTGLANRRLLTNRLRQVLERARPNRDPVAVAMLDLDGFKPINDSLGNAAGDELLRDVARRLQACVRSIDTVARWGGDEFMFVFPLVMGEDGARSAAARMFGALTPPITVRDQQVRLRASVGIALFPRHGSDPDKLLGHADAAMFAAKRDGGGLRVFGPGIQPGPASSEPAL